MVRIPPPRAWSAFRADLGAPKGGKEELRERLRTNGLHWRGNYALLALGLCCAHAFSVADFVLATGLIAAFGAGLVASPAWVAATDAWLRQSANASVGIFTDVATLEQNLTLVVKPPPLPAEGDDVAAAQQQASGLVAQGQTGAQQPLQPPQGDQVLSLPLATAQNGLRVIAFVCLLLSSPRGTVAVLQGLVVAGLLAALHAVLKPPTMGSAFTRLVNAASREDVQYATRAMRDKTQQGVSKFFKGLKRPGKPGTSAGEA